jgi:hypothetical protein
MVRSSIGSCRFVMRVAAISISRATHWPVYCVRTSYENITVLAITRSHFLASLITMRSDQAKRSLAQAFLNQDVRNLLSDNPGKREKS